MVRYLLLGESVSFVCLMNLKDLLPKSLPFTKPKETFEYFFALNITQDNVEGAVWGIEGNKLVIINSASHKYETEADLVKAANYALDEALADFQPEPVKVLFGVPDAWLQDDDLKPDFLRLLRKIVKELDVEPMAYVSTTHALSHMLQKNQGGTPLTAILVEVVDPLVVTVVKGGKALGSKIEKRTSDLPNDIEKALASFSDIEVLPSKIVIYGPNNVEKYKEELVGFSWMAQLPFLHLPKIETLDIGDTLKAVCLAGASELNTHIDYRFGKSTYDPNAVVSVGAHKASKLLEDNNLEETAGFVAGDIKQNASGYHPDDQAPRRHPQPLNNEYTNVYQKSNPLFKFFAPVLAFLPLSKLSLPAKMPKLTIIIPVAILFLLVLAYVFLPKAKVTVFLDMRILEKDAEVIADPNITAVDEEAKKIPGKTVTAEVDGSLKGEATGKKKVGEAAKGKIIVYNATSRSITLAKGTTMTADKGLKFVLDSEVQIASKSASAADPPSKSGVVDASASDIGPDGNISAGTDLTVGNYGKSDVVAKVETAFSGGVSKDVTVVSSDDQKRLLAALTSELRKKAQDDIQGSLEGGMKVLSEGLTEQIISQAYSKKVGDQATEFTLDLRAKYSGTAYNENDLKTIVSKLVETNVPEGYELDLSQTETQADVAKIEKDGRLIFAAKFRAKLMPKINQDQIRKDLAFKTPAEVVEKVRSIENVIGSNIEITPSLPGPLQRLPILPQNITVEITAK